MAIPASVDNDAAEAIPATLDRGKSMVISTLQYPRETQPVQASYFT